jgi:SAM-dependent methyltransferase
VDFENPDRMYLLFDALLNSRIGTALLPIYRRYIYGLGLTGSERVLEFGSGSGIASRHLADILMRGGGRLTCVDLSKRMTDTARKRLRKYPNVEIKVGDIRSLDIEDCAYGVAIVHFSLHDVEESIRLETVKALAGKLIAGGHLYLREPTERFDPMTVEAMREVMTRGGFTERSYRCTKAPLLGPMYEAVYERPS